VKRLQEDRHVFIVRLWLERREVTDAPPIRRGMLEQLSGGVRRYFQNLEELQRILEPLWDMTEPIEDAASIREPNVESVDAERADVPERDRLAPIEPALLRLDALLGEALLLAGSLFGVEAAQDPYRGLYLVADEMTRALARPPAAPTLSPVAPVVEPAEERPRRFNWLGRWFGRRSAAIPAVVAAAPEAPLAETVPDKTAARLPLVEDLPQTSPLVSLRDRFSLSSFELDALLVALAPELDMRYERLYAYLQDDVSRRRPSVDLVLNLLTASPTEKAAKREAFAQSGALLRHRLIQLTPDRDGDDTPLLGHFIKVDSQIVRFVLGERTLDPRLAPFAEFLPADVRAADSPGDFELLSFVAAAWEQGRSARLYLQGQPGSGRLRRIRWVAARLDLPLLVVDLPRALAIDGGLEWAPPLLTREALFTNALLYLRGFDTLRAEEHALALGRMWDALAQRDGPVFLAGAEPWVPVVGKPGAVLTIPFGAGSYSERKAEWERLLGEAGVTIAPGDVEALAARFKLFPGQMADALATARTTARWRAAAASEFGEVPPDQEPAPDAADLFAAARRETGHDLAALARRIEPLYDWDSIVLPDDTLLQLHEIAERVANRDRVLEGWGFDRKISQGKGTSVLFAGPSGTGKTMTAEILAADLRLDLYKIDLSSVVSKYIGETEKNLERIFQAAEHSNAILLFDEADALFGKRSEVRDSHDRYANIEISYLLQKMESYDGMAILSTNLRQNLDDAFVRRMAFTVAFPFPDEGSRLRIWRGIWPESLDVEFDDADLQMLAGRFKLSGGNIKNVALAAAFLAAAEGKPVRLVHLLRGVQREFQKMGKTLSADELQGRAPVKLAPSDLVRVA
jgi:hypothetical protein